MMKHGGGGTLCKALKIYKRLGYFSKIPMLSV
jgi:hypothetical protein